MTFTTANDLVDYFMYNGNKINWPAEIAKFKKNNDALTEWMSLTTTEKKKWDGTIQYLNISADFMRFVKNIYSFPVDLEITLLSKGKGNRLDWQLKQEWLEHTSVFVNTEDVNRDCAPKAEGLYLISNTIFNPRTDEKFYLVKVGKSTNLASRMKSYTTANPMVYHIDYYTGNKITETQCHITMLSSKFFQKVDNAQEWFVVDEKTYFELCEQGFDYFLKRNA